MNDINKYYEAAEILKVLGHPTRLCIVNGLLKNNGCNVSFMQGCLNIPQSTVSQHLSKLKSAGIIAGERKGLEITYKVVNKIAIDLVTHLFSE
ncbi:MAG: metalloregulator ArsR/SmtB family transcription factor [Vallitalea sp.]|jgi:ArsR family transcriptional regulator|nr:metalloregulator ArsR/SmtB family transcription factor [Vallitalea sp.]